MANIERHLRVDGQSIDEFLYEKLESLTKRGATFGDLRSFIALFEPTIEKASNEYSCAFLSPSPFIVKPVAEEISNLQRLLYKIPLPGSTESSQDKLPLPDCFRSIIAEALKGIGKIGSHSPEMLARKEQDVQDRNNSSLASPSVYFKPFTNGRRATHY